jgi:hypothetical protein
MTGSGAGGGAGAVSELRCPELRRFRRHLLPIMRHVNNLNLSGSPYRIMTFFLQKKQHHKNSVCNNFIFTMLARCKNAATALAAKIIAGLSGKILQNFHQ